MLNNFWNSLERESVIELGYVTHVPYSTESKLRATIDKIDLVLNTLHRHKEDYKYDCDVVDDIRERIITGAYSLTSSGVDFLNVVAHSIKDLS